MLVTAELTATFNVCAVAGNANAASAAHNAIRIPYAIPVSHRSASGYSGRLRSRPVARRTPRVSPAASHGITSGAMNILSIQSWVAYGHVGNASAVFPLQRLGAEVWAINTVQFSNHTGYGAWRGAVYSGDSVREVVDGIADRGALGRCDAVLSG